MPISDEDPDTPPIRSYHSLFMPDATKSSGTSSILGKRRRGYPLTDSLAEQENFASSTYIADPNTSVVNRRKYSNSDESSSHSLKMTPPPNSPSKSRSNYSTITPTFSPPSRNHSRSIRITPPPPSPSQSPTSPFLTPAKRGRGRPRKVNSSQPPPMRGRGRPRKVHSSPTPPKRGRGRPKKTGVSTDFFNDYLRSLRE